MSDAWSILGAVLEGRPPSKGPIGDLLDYVSKKHGEHEADQLFDFMKSNPVPDILKHVAVKYMDDRADKLASRLSSLVGGGEKRPVGRPPKAATPAEPGRSSDKGSGPSEPIPARPSGQAKLPPMMPPAGAGSGQAMGTAGRALKPQQYTMPGAKSGPTSSAGVEPSVSPVQKPDRPGDFIGQHWQPAAYSAPEPTRKDPTTGVVTPGEIEAVKNEIDAELSRPNTDLDRVKQLQTKLGLLQRRMGGFKNRSIQHGSQATGQMSKGAVAQNPARPGSVVRRTKDPETGEFRNVRWDEEHPGWKWAGSKYGWISPSKFAALVGAGELPRSRR